MEVTFILPLLLLPGVGQIILSTTTRYGQLHEEIHRLVSMPEMAAEKHLWARSRRLRDALMGLYLCVCIFALTSLSGVTLEVLGLSSRWPIVALTSLGCLCLLYAAYQLVRESFLSLESIEGHLKQYRIANQGESYDKR
jgi:hypothetical protein